MKINITKIQDDLRGKWWQHIRSEDFGFLNRIRDLENYNVNNNDILIHKEIKEGERFPTVRYYIVSEKEIIQIENEKVKEKLAGTLVEFVRKNKKLPFACKFIKVFKNGSAQVDYHPGEFENFALKIVPKVHGIESSEKFFSNLETTENPIKVPKEKTSQRGKWEIPSSKDPNKKYTVVLHDNSIWTCTCPHYTFRKTECHHIKECKNKI